MPGSRHDDCRPPFRVGDWTVEPSLDRLTRNGGAHHVRPQVMDLLVVLATRAGEVVTNDEVHDALWPGLTVNEDAVTRCVCDLRKALGDVGVDHPRYIENIPKRGYRLLVPAGDVEVTDRSGAARAAAPPRRRAVIVVALALGLGAVLVGTWVARRAPRPQAPAEHQRVLVGHWANETGDTAFGRTLADTVAAALARSDGLDVVPDRAVTQVLGMMLRPADTALTGEIGREACERVGAVAMVGGRVAKFGERFVIRLDAHDCLDGRALARAAADAARGDQVLAAVDRAAAELGSGLLASLPRPATSSRPLADATSPILDAVKSFTLGEEALARGENDHAVGLLKNAVALDPGFPLAWAKLGSVYASLGERTRARECARQARAGYPAAGRAERFAIDAWTKRAEGREQEEAETLEAWVRALPNAAVAHARLAEVALARGDRQKAVRHAREAARLDSGPAVRRAAALMYLGAGEVGVAERIAREDDLPLVTLLIALFRGDAAEVDRTTAVMPSQDAELQGVIGSAQASLGRHEAAIQAFHAGQTMFERQGYLEAAATLKAAEALWEAEIGDPAQACVHAGAALRTGGDLLLADFALASCGLAEEAERSLRGEAETLAAQMRLENVRGGLQVLLASIALHQRRPGTTLVLLADHVDDLASAPASVARGDLMNLGAFNLRGRAWLATGDARRAVSEFRTLLENGFVAPLSPHYARAPIELGRAYATLGDRAAARAAYARFLARWSTADADVPLLLTARREHDQLEGR